MVDIPSIPGSIKALVHNKGTSKRVSLQDLEIMYKQLSRTPVETNVIVVKKRYQFQKSNKQGEEYPTEEETSVSSNVHIKTEIENRNFKIKKAFTESVEVVQSLKTDTFSASSSSKHIVKGDRTYTAEKSSSQSQSSSSSSRNRSKQNEDNSVSTSDSSATQTNFATGSSSSKDQSDKRKTFKRKGKIQTQLSSDKEDKVPLIGKSHRAKLRSTKTKRNKSRSNYYNYEYVMGIHLHNTSDLKFKKYIKAPRIKVSWYNSKTGQLAQKSKDDRNVVFNYEPENVSYIQPIISKEGRVFEQNQFSFKWDELLLINEDIEYMKDVNFIVFFELIDIVSSNKKMSKFKVDTSGWYHICWGFLKPVLSNSNNIDRQCVLQLFKYKKNKNLISVFDQFSNPKLVRYPSTLNVTLTNVKPNLDKIELSRPHTAFQMDKHENPLLESSTEIESDIENDGKKRNGSLDNNKNIDILQKLKWRKTLQTLQRRTFSCPSSIISNRNFEKGSTVCAFSPDGQTVAFAEKYNINIGSVPDIKIIFCMQGHTGIVHSLQWMPINYDKFNKYIASTSEDRSCIIWLLERTRYSMQHVLPHSAFVYSATFLIISKNIFKIATGGKDCVFRIWRIDRKKKISRLHQEHSRHSSYIVGICFDMSSSEIYTAEVFGHILGWKLKGDNKSWEFKRKITTLPGPLQQIYIHPKIKRIYVATDSRLFSVDIKSGLPKLSFDEVSTSSTNKKFKFTISKCGSYMFISTHINTITCCNLITEVALDTIKLRTSMQSFISSIDCNSDGKYLGVSIYGKHEGGFSIFEFKDEVESNISNDSSTKPILNENKKYRNILGGSKNFDEILNKLDMLFQLKRKTSINKNNDEKIQQNLTPEKIVTDHNEETDSIHQKKENTKDKNLSEKTFTLSKKNMSANTFILEKGRTDDESQNTFTVKNDENTDDTDISESLNSSDNDLK